MQADDTDAQHNCGLTWTPGLNRTLLNVLVEDAAVQIERHACALTSELNQALSTLSTPIDADQCQRTKSSGADICLDPHVPLAAFQERLTSFRAREAAWGGRFILEGVERGPNPVRLDGNDYLQLTGDESIVQAQVEALQQSHQFIVQSGIFLQANDPTRKLEADLAALIGKEDVHLCASGYAANMALLQALASPGVPVYLDSLAHMSLWEGARAAGAQGQAFRHNDVEHLEKLIVKGGPGVVVVDSVYSGTGALCPLVAIADLCERTGCTFVVDESHSLGLYGTNGAGLCAALGITHRVHFITASLAKAFAARAGMYTAPRRMRPYFAVTAYTTVFSSCLLPPEIAGLRATLKLVKAADEKRARLHACSRRLRRALAEIGYPVHQGSEQIICLEAGAEPDTMRLRDEFEKRGIVGAIFATPATAANRSMLRLTLHAGLTDADLDRVEAAAREAAEVLKPWEWRSARRRSLS